MLQPIILQAIGWQALHASAIIVIEPEVNLFRTSLALGFGFEGAPLSVMPEPETG
jgi:hypothetical protein